MPTYQYACRECGHEFEAVQKFSDDALTECPTCTGTLRKVFAAVGVVFKGSGFYRTDSRGTEKKSSSGDSGSGSSAGDSSGSSTSTSTSKPSSSAPAKTGGESAA